jgi:hypothetical protein
LLAAGAEFSVVHHANGEVRFVHYLNRGPIHQLACELAKAHDVEYWTNSDPHYTRDAGFSCSKCRLAVAWDQDKAVLSAI